MEVVKSSRSHLDQKTDASARILYHTHPVNDETMEQNPCGLTTHDTIVRHHHDDHNTDGNTVVSSINVRHLNRDNNNNNNSNIGQNALYNDDDVDILKPTTGAQYDQEEEEEELHDCNYLTITLDDEKEQFRFCGTGTSTDHRGNDDVNNIFSCTTSTEKGCNMTYHHGNQRNTYITKNYTHIQLKKSKHPSNTISNTRTGTTTDNTIYGSSKKMERSLPSKNVINAFSSSPTITLRTDACNNQNSTRREEEEIIGSRHIIPCTPPNNQSAILFLSKDCKVPPVPIINNTIAETVTVTTPTPTTPTPTTSSCSKTDEVSNNDDTMMMSMMTKKFLSPDKVQVQQQQSQSPIQPHTEDDETTNVVLDAATVLVQYILLNDVAATMETVANFTTPDDDPTRLSSSLSAGAESSSLELTKSKIDQALLVLKKTKKQQNVHLLASSLSSSSSHHQVKQQCDDHDSSNVSTEQPNQMLKIKTNEEVPFKVASSSSLSRIQTLRQKRDMIEQKVRQEQRERNMNHLIAQQHGINNNNDNAKKSKQFKEQKSNRVSTSSSVFTASTMASTTYTNTSSTYCQYDSGESLIHNKEIDNSEGTMIHIENIPVTPSAVTTVSANSPMLVSPTKAQISKKKSSRTTKKIDHQMRMQQQQNNKNKETDLPVVVVDDKSSRRVLLSKIPSSSSSSAAAAASKFQFPKPLGNNNANKPWNKDKEYKNELKKKYDTKKSTLDFKIPELTSKDDPQKEISELFLENEVHQETTEYKLVVEKEKNSMLLEEDMNTVVPNNNSAESEQELSQQSSLTSCTTDDTEITKTTESDNTNNPDSNESNNITYSIEEYQIKLQKAKKAISVVQHENTRQMKLCKKQMVAQELSIQQYESSLRDANAEIRRLVLVQSTQVPNSSDNNNNNELNLQNQLHVAIEEIETLKQENRELRARNDDCKILLDEFRTKEELWISSTTSLQEGNRASVAVKSHQDPPNVTNSSLTSEEEQEKVHTIIESDHFFGKETSDIQPTNDDYKSKFYVLEYQTDLLKQWCKVDDLSFIPKKLESCQRTIDGLELEQQRMQSELIDFKENNVVLIQELEFVRDKLKDNKNLSPSSVFGSLSEMVNQSLVMQNHNEHVVKSPYPQQDREIQFDPTRNSTERNSHSTEQNMNNFIFPIHVVQTAGFQDPLSSMEDDDLAVNVELLRESHSIVNKIESDLILANKVIQEKQEEIDVLWNLLESQKPTRETMERENLLSQLQFDYSIAITERNDAEGKLRELQDRCNNMSIDDIPDKLLSYSTELETLVHNTECMLSRLNDSEQIIQQLESEIQLLNHDNEKLSTDKEKVDHILLELEKSYFISSLDEIPSYISVVTDEVEELQKQLNELQLESRSRQTESTQENEEMSTKIQTLESLVENERRKREDVQDKVKYLVCTCDATDVQEVSEKYNKLLTDLSETRLDISLVQEQNAKLNEEKSNLIQQMINLKTKLDTPRGEVEQNCTARSGGAYAKGESFSMSENASGSCVLDEDEAFGCNSDQDLCDKVMNQDEEGSMGVIGTVGTIQQSEELITKLQRKLRESKKALKTCEGTIVELKDSLNRAQATLIQTKEELGTKTEETTNLNEELHSLKLNLEEQYNKVSALEMVVHDINESLKEAQYQRDAAVAPGQEIGRLENMLERKEREIHVLQKEIDALDGELTKTRIMVNDVEQERNFYSAKMSELQNILTLRQDAEKERYLLEKSMENAELNTERDALMKKLQVAESLAKTLQDENKEKTALLREMGQRCASGLTTENLIHSLQNENDRALKKAMDTSMRLAECHMRIDELTGTIKKMRRTSREITLQNESPKVSPQEQQQPNRLSKSRNHFGVIRQSIREKISNSDLSIFTDQASFSSLQNSWSMPVLPDHDNENLVNRLSKRIAVLEDENQAYKLSLVAHKSQPRIDA